VLPINGLFSDKKYRIDKKYQNKVMKMAISKNYREIIISARWTYLLNKKGNPAYYYYDSKKKTYLNKGNLQHGLRLFSQMLKTLTKLKSTFIVLSNPEDDRLNPAYFLKQNRFYDVKQIMRSPNYISYSQDQKELNLLISKIAKEAGAKVIDPDELLIKNGKVKITTQNGSFIYKDRDHLRASYVRKHASFIDKTILEKTEEQ
jgi:hypothetical protein